MATLTQNLSADSLLADVSAPLVAGVSYHLGDEVVLARGAHVTNYGELNRLRWNISRGQDRTTRTSHSSGVAFTEARVYEEGGGGSGVTVDNQSDLPAAVTTLIAPGATISGDEATLNNPWTVNEEGGLVADLTEAEILNNVIAVTAPGGDGGFLVGSDGRVEVLQDSAGGATALLVTAADDAAKLQVQNRSLTSLFDVRTQGNVTILPTATATRIFQCYDSDGNEVFRVSADGSVHIKTGTSIVADL